jgi:hypothetical protein
LPWCIGTGRKASRKHGEQARNECGSAGTKGQHDGLLGSMVFGVLVANERGDTSPMCDGRAEPTAALRTGSLERGVQFLTTLASRFWTRRSTASSARLDRQNPDEL